MKQTPLVYHLPCSLNESTEQLVDGLDRMLFAADPFAGIAPGQLVAIKTHLGEEGNRGHVPPIFIARIGKALRDRGARPFVCETSTLYVGRRSHAVDHLMLAYEHGFTPDAIGMPVIMADGLRGHGQKEVEIPGIHHGRVFIAADVPAYDHLVVVSHVTGHICSGMGACLKNLGMGLASRAGKLVQHSDITPQVATERCTRCGACLPWCPAEAIRLGTAAAIIDEGRCIGCGECLSVCGFSAIRYNWNQESRVLQEKMVEHALAVVRSLRGGITAINFAWKLTKNCDCMAKDDPAVCPDVGILLSADPVALDAATLNQVSAAHGSDVFVEQHPDVDPEGQLRHGEAIGLGSCEYRLQTVPR